MVEAHWCWTLQTARANFLQILFLQHTGNSSIQTAKISGKPQRGLRRGIRLWRIYFIVCSTHVEFFWGGGCLAFIDVYKRGNPVPFRACQRRINRWMKSLLTVARLSLETRSSPVEVTVVVTRSLESGIHQDHFHLKAIWVNYMQSKS